ncbi:MAG: response regulator [Deltaproteobacteria bacterium]|nr:MAG: response regulator [Deltaproteobacteria bacterium]
MGQDKENPPKDEKPQRSTLPFHVDPDEGGVITSQPQTHVVRTPNPPPNADLPPPLHASYTSRLTPAPATRHMAPPTPRSRTMHRLKQAAQTAKHGGPQQDDTTTTDQHLPTLGAVSPTSPISRMTPPPATRQPNVATPATQHKENTPNHNHKAEISELMKTMSNEEIDVAKRASSGSVTGFVLIVEDDVVNSRILQIHLEKTGLDTHVARDGHEALQIASELRPDLIVLDVMLPSMNGFEICERVRKIKDLDDIPIIFLTSQETEEEMLHAYEIGADDYIPKSQFKPTVLAAKIKKFLRRRERHLSQSVETLKSGMVIDGRYEILREIGRGGMGMVYLVRHQRLGFTLALKAMSVDRPNREKSVQRFMREIQSLAELHHPNLVRIHDCGEYGQIPYYVMEYIPGGSLFQRLQHEGAIRPREALSIVGKLSAGLQCAHESRILHRDLKTENILFKRDGEPVLTDFGLVLNFADDSKRLTKVGCVVGTPHYMSPEQITQPNDIDGRSDVFSLGIVLYEMLTGQNPLLHYNRTEVMIKIVTEDIPSPLTLNPHIPPQAVGICMRALRRKRSERFPSALAMSLACNQIARTL